MAIEVKEDIKGASADRPESEEVFFCGDGPYEFTFPKVGALLSKLRRAGQEASNDNEKGSRYWDLQLDWLERGFGTEQFSEIIDRLEDEDDFVEEEHINELFKLLIKASTGRPTTSPKGSSRSRSASKRPAARSRKGSGSETSTPESVAT